MDAFSRPSSSAIALPCSVEHALDALVAGLGAQGYRRYDKSIPSWHALGDDEWLGLTATQVGPLAVLLPEHQGWTFRIACAIAVQDPEFPVVAYRRQLGMASCFKYYALGEPQFKHGDDPDLEVEWNIATGLAVDVPTPEESGLPGTAEDFETALGVALRPYQAHKGSLGPGDRCIGLLHRRSDLWL